MKKYIVLVFVILALVLAACGAAAPVYTSRSLEAAPGAAPLPSAKQDAMGTNNSSDSGTGGGTGTSESAPLHNRLVIKDASLTIVVKDPQTKMDAIIAMANSMGGWVVSSNMGQISTSSGDIVPQGTISIRVPADQLDTAINQIKADAIEVRSQSSNGQDVTAEFTDLQSRLNNLEREEADLLAIMDEAKNNPNSNTSSQTQDVLQVYSSIAQVRGEIEQVKGQMQYYQQSSDTSLINVTLIAEATVKPIEIGGWKPEGVARDAIQGLVKFLEGFVNFLIWLVLFVLPILIVIFGPIALIVWGSIALARRQRSKKAAKA